MLTGHFVGFSKYEQKLTYSLRFVSVQICCVYRFQKDSETRYLDGSESFLGRGSHHNGRFSFRLSRKAQPLQESENKREKIVLDKFNKVPDHCRYIGGRTGGRTDG